MGKAAASIFLAATGDFQLVHESSRCLHYQALATGILSVCVIGSLAYGDTDAATLMLVFACVGLVLEAGKYPLAPVILGLVLAPIIEVSLRRALIMEGFDLLAVVTQPLAAMILLIAHIFLVGPWAARAVATARHGRSTPKSTSTDGD